MKFLIILFILGIAQAQELIAVSNEVSEALKSNKPVVALESTIIAHGMPYPQNLKTALEVEKVVRDAGAIPATIAIIKGIPHVGLSIDELEILAKGGSNIPKVSRRDLADVVSRSENGATTVSATMLLASMAGISIFVTGGIGGVHRGVEETMDISADLNELGRTPVCVVSAGVKSLLDIGRTLEVLETNGVSVIGFDTSDFPAFFTRNSGFKAPIRLNTSEQCAKLIDANQKLKLTSGILVAVPIPESDAADGLVIESAIQSALSESKDLKIGGRDVTPFILKRVNELTHGASLKSNIALVKNNAKIGSEIAVQLSKIRSINHLSKNYHTKLTASLPHKVIVFGGAIIDVLSKPSEKLLPRTTSSGTVSLQWGGVGRNIAEALTRLGELNPLLITAISDDTFGKFSIEHLKELGMSTEGLLLIEHKTGNICIGEDCYQNKATEQERHTALCNAVMNEKGEQIAGICDTDIVSELTPERVTLFESQISQTSLVIMDGNLPTQTIQTITQMCLKYHVKILYEPTSVPKSTKIFAIESPLSAFSFITPNKDELSAMSNALPQDKKQGFDMLTIKGQCSALVRSGINTVIVKLGDKGGMICENGNQHHGNLDVQITEFLPPNPSPLVNVVGAGDSFVSGIVWGMLARGLTVVDSISLGTKAAKLSLESVNPISPLLSSQTILS